MMIASQRNAVVEYPEIVSGMKMAERREAVSWLREHVPAFLWNKEFEADDAAEEILNKPVDLPCNERKQRASGGKELMQYLGKSARLPLLTAEEEVFYFRRMNFLKWRAARTISELDDARPRLTPLRSIVADLKASDRDRNWIAEHNLRLVIPLAHRFRLRSESVWDFISEGNAALLRAVKGFDYGRGFRFSTYATWAIMNSLQRLAGKQHRDSGRFVPSEAALFDSEPGEIEGELAEALRVSLAREQVGSLLNVLDHRSQKVIAMRYGIGEISEPMTLREVGEHIGVTKERVRQIEKKALSSMMSSQQRSVA